jgi:xanthine dehydrogenase accessory factor
MVKQILIWDLIGSSLARKAPVMLLYVLESAGSSPGRQGFFMAVNLPGEMEGSLGGGIMEYKFVEMAKAKLQEQSEEISVHQQLHDKSAPRHQSGMICSGEQTILLYKVHDTDEEAINKITNCLKNNGNATLQLSPAGISFTDQPPLKDYSFVKNSEEDWIYTEKVGYKNHLHIIGGGHCALAFSKIMSMMDFYIHLYDERKNLNTMLRNVYAHEKHEVKDYNELTDIIPEGDHYVVIMTFGYRSDYTALWAILNKKFKYVGLLGSKNKIDKMFADYRHEGVEETVLEAIHAPVGINIKSQTPEEIAVSIAAEIIKVKNGEMS